MKKLLLLAGFVLLFVLCSASGIGYALSGGGARGFAHIGILKVLEEEGIQPGYISGTSIGAIIGAFYSMGFNAAEIESLALEIKWQEILEERQSRKDLYIGQKRWAPYGNITFELNEYWAPQLPSSVYNVNNVNLKLFELYAAGSVITDFNDLPIPFSCVGTNLVSGQPKVFNRGSIMQAVRASMSIPSILQPFAIDGDIYIDGGISQNLPINVVKDMGASSVVGIKVNSSLRNKETLTNLIEVLDQTINIGITRNLSEDLGDCDLLLEPDLSSFSSTDFEHVAELIAIGENYARSQIMEIRAYAQSQNATSTERLNSFNRKRDHFFVQRINVLGNDRLSAEKIREYLRLESEHTYSTDHILQACLKTWNSQFFRVIYPVLVPLGDDQYELQIHVTEKANKTLTMNNSYNSDVKLTASAILRLNNYLLKNSILLAELQLGGKNELNVDYVKNFGELWGIYYRVFPYVNEKTMYVYDDDHHRTNSVKSLEWGATSGIGLFSPKQGAIEFFTYRSDTYLYRGIAETDVPPRNYQVSGFGVKGLYESVDDYVFPQSGLRFLGKFNFARDEKISDYVYSKFTGKLEAYCPINHSLSLMSSIDIGTFFNSAPSDKFDPYPLGGADAFMAFPKYEISAPHYRILQGGIVLEPKKNIFIHAGIQHLSYDMDELWGNNYDSEHCYYAGIGINTVFVPIKLAAALSGSGRYNTIFSVGYDFDIFRYSRK
ncbi:MAG: patatin-like phospholipase family protein [Candidatus Cloacimonadaceae bacterium]|jgi:NTE family protein|nr:patatin-like phospholipase family protein [Candidatus Cloacimonadaceae bacterium]